MPLHNSGAALFAGSADEFVSMAPASSLTAHVTREFNRRWGSATESEVRSWKNSLTALAGVVAGADLSHSAVGVELKLPFSNRRIDCSFVARDAKGRPQVRLIELKQWSEAAPSVFPDNVIVGPRELLHPSVQAASYAAYLRDSHSAFTEDDFGLDACAFLHNMSPEAARSLRGFAFDAAIAEAPFFVQGEEADLARYLGTAFAGGDGMDLLPSLTHGRYSPSKALIAGVAQGLADSPIWTLLDEQRVAYNIVRGLVSRAVASGEKGVVLVRGGPGTGKSVIAAHLLVDLSRDGKIKVAHATGSKAFTTNLRAISPKGASALFRYFNNFIHKQTEEDDLDVLLCDEAHRIRATSNSQYTKRALRSEIPQVEELIRAAKVSVFLLDERQNVRVDEVGTVASIRAAAESAGVGVHELSLAGQFRCNGCAGYIEWVDTLMSAEPMPVGPWHSAGEYELEVFGDPRELERRILEHAKAGASARMVAGFCWPWSDPQPDGSLVDDVVIGDWKRPWNEKSREQQKGKKSQPAPKKHPYYLWTTEPERVREVGCIYSAQGFEFDYCGVILGNDLVWREGVGWLGSREASEDSQIRRRKLEQGELLALLQHTYRVLLTRGMKGTYIYSTDAETRLFLASLMSPAAASATRAALEEAASALPEGSAVALTAFADLLDPLGQELKSWLATKDRDQESLNRIVARHYGPLGAYTTAKHLKEKGKPDILEVTFTPGPDVDPVRGEELYTRGLELVHEGELEAALGAFEESILADPLNSAVYAARGQALLEIGRPEDAERPLMLALTLDPQSWESKTMLGNTYYAMGNLELAKAVHQAAVTLNSNEHTLTNLGGTLGKRQEYREARDAFKLALKFNRANSGAQYGLRLCEAALAREASAGESIDSEMAGEPGDT